jgi:hypothetical protein
MNAASESSNHVVSVGAGGVELDLTDSELTDAAPLVVHATISTRSVVEFHNDPYLPAGWESDEGTARMVNGGGKQVKWQTNITSWLKGSSATSIWVVRGIEGVHFSAAASEGGLNPNEIGYDPQPGDSVKLWLSPDTWFNQDHFILLKAALL